MTEIGVEVEGLLLGVWTSNFTPLTKDVSKRPPLIVEKLLYRNVEERS